MLCVVTLFKHTVYSLYWNQKKFCKSEQREDNSYNLPIGQSKLAMLTFWFISIVNDGKQKSEISLRVKIN